MRLPPLLDRLFRRLVQAWRTRGVSLKALSFALVGVVNTLIDLGIFLVAYNLLGLPLIPANVLAWLRRGFRLLCDEFVHHLRGRIRAPAALARLRHVRRLRRRRRDHQYGDRWWWRRIWIPVLAAKLLAIVASFVVNFSLSHFVVFRTRERRVEPSVE